VGEGAPLAESPLGPFLAEAGLVRSGPGFRLPGAPAIVPADEDPHPDEEDG
jgi:hypothetical protein